MSVEPDRAEDLISCPLVEKSNHCIKKTVYVNGYKKIFSNFAPHNVY